MTVGWARFCAHPDTKPRGQTINLSAHPTLFSENKFTLGWGRASTQVRGFQPYWYPLFNRVSLFYSHHLCIAHVLPQGGEYGQGKQDQMSA